MSDPTPLDRVREICLGPAGGHRATQPRLADVVGHRGWAGVHLNRRLDWNEIAGTIEEAYLVVAPKRLADEAIRRRARG